MSKPVQHGIRGAYYGGEWLPIEECDAFSIPSSSSSCNRDCASCPRSRSGNSAASPKDGSYDVVVIGAGCVGASIARELSKYTCSVLVVDAADDVTQGATKGNSGIVHSGYDDTPGSVRAKYCWPGNQMFSQLDRELRFGYQKNGSMVLAFNDDEVKELENLMARGNANGVRGMSIIDRDEILRLEPHVNPEVVAALRSTEAGNLIPYEFTIALMENAVDNGVELRIRREVKNIEQMDDGYQLTIDHWEPPEYLDAVRSTSNAPSRHFGLVGWTIAGALALAGAYFTMDQPVLALCLVLVCVVAVVNTIKTLYAQDSPSITEDVPVGKGGKVVSVDQMKFGGSGSSAVMKGEVVERETVQCRFIVNAAGSASDSIARMVGDDSFEIKPRVGDYLLMHRNQGHLARHTLFPAPDPVLGKGVLVQATLWGNLILGPTARDAHLPDVINQSPEQIRRYILGKSQRLVPAFEPSKVIHSFAGSRAKAWIRAEDGGVVKDWVVGVCKSSPRMVHAAGIDSPGLAGSPAIALDVVRMLQDDCGLKLAKDPNFNPNRAPIITPKAGWKVPGVGLIKVGEEGVETDPRKNVVCKCEKVTEEEVVRAIRRSLPIDSTQAIRKRCRAGMGHCQGRQDNYNCEVRVANILARELKLPASAIGRRPWPASSILPHRWQTDDEKSTMVKSDLA